MKSSFALVAILFVACPTAVSHATDLEAEIGAMLPEHVGAAVLVIRDGETVLKAGYGVTQIEGGEPCTPQTNFRLASVSKQFTAAAVLIAAERGLLSVDDTLDEFFPGAPAYWSDISVHQLLTHTSGLADYEDLVPEGTKLQLYDQNVLELLLGAAEAKLSAGEKWEYSNSGYVLLGLVVEQASGEAFHAFMRKQIFNRLGMEGSCVFQRGLNQVPHRAFGHVKRGGAWVTEDQSLTSAVRGDGTVYSSVDDLEKWLGGLGQNELFRQPLRDRMFAPHVQSTRGTDDTPRAYGYGWFIDEHQGRPRVWHSGSTRGFRLRLMVYPDSLSAVAVLMNCEADDPDPGACERIAERWVLQ
ncbi:MAG: serine hydrolase domain-containing protein [Planctomycetota bacterium]